MPIFRKILRIMDADIPGKRYDIPLHIYIFATLLAVLLPSLLLFSLMNYLTTRQHLLAYSLELRHHAEQQFDTITTSFLLDCQDAHLPDGTEVFEVMQCGEYIGNTLRRQMMFSFIIGVSAVVVAICLGMLVSKSLSNPLIQFMNDVNLIVQGNFHHHIEKTFVTELNILGQSINTLRHDMLRFIGQLKASEQEIQPKEQIYQASFGSANKGGDHAVILSGEPLLYRKDCHRAPETGIETWLRAPNVPFRSNQGVIPGLLEINRDRPGLDIAEQTLTADHNLLRTLIDNLSDHVYVKDLQGRFMLSNAANLRFMGFTSYHDLIGKTDFDLFKPEDAQKFFDDEQRVIHAKKTLINQEGHHQNPETGEEVWLLTTKVPFLDNQGNMTGLIGINRDITERKLAEEELKKHRDHLEKLVQKRTAKLLKANKQLQELNASKDKFLSIISHDLRSPFTTILGYTRVIAGKGLDYFERDELKVLFDDLATGAENLHKLLENLLTWARVQLGSMEFQPATLDLHDIVAENVSLFSAQAKQKQIVLSNTVFEKTWAYADQNMVDTVIRNTISNALKFTDTHGAIVISSKNTETEVEIAVSDTGVGIEQDKIEHLFRIDTKYKTTGTAGEKGTGLGLILCKDLIEKHEGQIWVESEAGKGTTFLFTLPFPPSELLRDK